jgi:hypothetical protein
MSVERRCALQVLQACIDRENESSHDTSDCMIVLVGVASRLLGFL